MPRPLVDEVPDRERVAADMAGLSRRFGPFARSLGVDARLLPDYLDRLDEIAAGLRAALLKLSPAEFDSTLRYAILLFAAYAGELIRRATDAGWDYDAARGATVLRLADDSLLYVVDAAIRALTTAAAPTLADAVQTARQAVDSSDP